jgi:fumarylpyruvate hydrolase
MSYIIPVWDMPSIPIAGRSERFPVRHIYCVGRNYSEHAKEMGGDASKEPPFFFTKPADAIVPVVDPDVGSVRYPRATKNYQYELELVAAVGAAGANLAPERANEIIYGYAVGLDMTRRGRQNTAVGSRQVFRGGRAHRAGPSRRRGRSSESRPYCIGRQR